MLLRWLGRWLIASLAPVTGVMAGDMLPTVKPQKVLLLAGVEASTVGFEETILSSWPSISIYDAALFD